MKLLSAFLFVISAISAQVIEGVVVNSTTGLPLGGVTVTIASSGKTAYQTTTDVQGGFRIEGVKPGSYTADFSKAEYLPLERNSPARRPFSVAGSDPARINASLTPLGRVSGRVLDADGNPVREADLLLDSSRFGLSKSSDAAGNFSFTA